MRAGIERRDKDLLQQELDELVLVLERERIRALRHPFVEVRGGYLLTPVRTKCTMRSSSGRSEIGEVAVGVEPGARQR